MRLSGRMALPEEPLEFEELSCEECRVFIEKSLLVDLCLPAELEFVIPQEGTTSVMITDAAYRQSTETKTSGH